MTNEILFNKMYLVLLGHFGSEKFVDTWLDSENFKFGMAKPYQMWMDGHCDFVSSYVFTMCGKPDTNY